MSGGADLRTVAMTALEIASAMTFLHIKDIVHGVSFTHLLTQCDHACICSSRSELAIAQANSTLHPAVCVCQMPLVCDLVEFACYRF